MKLIPVFCSLFLSIQVMMALNPFTERELEIIFCGEESEPFRILLTTDKVDSAILRMQSTDFTPANSIANNDSLQYFLSRLHATLNDAGGVGIAAPQVGILKNIFLFQRIDKPGQPVQVAINPKIVDHSYETICFVRDGCLSIPDISGNSVRYPWIIVEYFDEKGVLHNERLEGTSRFNDFTSIIFQHEFDHLKGILFTDKIYPPEISDEEMLHRVSLDFNRSRDDIINWIEQYQGFTPNDDLISKWEESGILEYRVIDEEKRYFRNAAPNIFRVSAEARELAKTAVKSAESGAKRTLDTHLNELRPSDIKGKYLLPEVSTKVRYSLSVPASSATDDELIKAWLPYPRKDISRQSDVVFFGASQPDFIISDDKTDHTSIYMEQLTEKDEPTTFSVEFSFSSQGVWYDLSEIEPLPYNKASELYKEYTSQKLPHVQFSERIIAITDSITKNNGSAIEDLQTIYRFITSNYPWASAIEYSTIPNIPEYVLDNNKGDCGQVALLLITMLRYKGIPARWQSGWMTHPGEVNLHDWAEAYFEGVGWIPVDVSFGRGEPLDNELGREFFMSGIDSYRLYINNDFSDSFFPAKSFPRSETIDFQRGEVETNSKNLYFDKWRYRMEVISQETIDNK